MKTYFDTAVRENRYYSEDWTFCENWRDLGGKIWVDKRVLLRHTGTYVFDYAAQEQLYKDLHSLALSNGTALSATQVPATAAPVTIAAQGGVESLPQPAEAQGQVVTQSKGKKKK
jgi:hypothetical protein